ncbi:MAG: DUF1513 domain-containing protein [Aliishimia sp.]
MTTPSSGRRRFLTGMLATGLIPKATWADAGAPRYVSAAARPDGGFVLCGIDHHLEIVFRLPLPARGHAAAAHPNRPEVVAFARRPGTFAIVLDCVSGMQIARLSAPNGRHFYGHGVFSQDGSKLFTTENDFGVGQGVVGVWDVARGYERVGEFASGGVGPHDIKRLPSSDVLVIANGGIDTHPESGRTKLNIPTMRPNLAYVEDEQVIETAELTREFHKKSIRHLAISSTNDVAMGMQSEGDPDETALVGLHRRGQPIQLMQSPDAQLRAMQGYIGSIAFSGDDLLIAATSPRGNLVHIYDAADRELIDAQRLQDVCGVSSKGRGFLLTAGTGEICHIRDSQGYQNVHNLMWDNHLVPIPNT